LSSPQQRRERKVARREEEKKPQMLNSRKVQALNQLLKKMLSLEPVKEDKRNLILLKNSINHSNWEMLRRFNPLQTIK
jgi:hypothetical protein